MKIKTSITLSKNLLKEIDSIISKSGNRSLFIEEAIKNYLNHKKRFLRNQNDLEIINRSADDLNKEAEDTLSYQVKI
jgi:metal-responsive CopG/Arc/MetJ family transcriptional regulator